MPILYGQRTAQRLRAFWDTSFLDTRQPRFFQVAPAGQDHFKQSTTRLYFIADKIFEMTMEMFHSPRMMVEAGACIFQKLACQKPEAAFHKTVWYRSAPALCLQDISALGLRHVGYAIPTELFAPFVSCAVEAVRMMTTDEVAEAAFRWSLTLISKILVRTILEGSTIAWSSAALNQLQHSAASQSSAAHMFRISTSRQERAVVLR